MGIADFRLNMHLGGQGAWQTRMPSPPSGQRLEPPTPHPKAEIRLLVFQWGELEVDLYLYLNFFSQFTAVGL